MATGSSGEKSVPLEYTSLQHNKSPDVGPSNTVYYLRANGKFIHRFSGVFVNWIQNSSTLTSNFLCLLHILVAVVLNIFITLSNCMLTFFIITNCTRWHLWSETKHSGGIKWMEPSSESITMLKSTYTQIKIFVYKITYLIFWSSLLMQELW